MQILVVDDDALVREAAKIMLSVKGHHVTLAENGKAGIEAARKERFDVAIVDLFMPGMDGLQVIETIRNERPDLPLIAASGFMFDGDCPPMPNFDSMAEEAGATTTLYKPFRPQALWQAIAKAVETNAVA